MIKYTFWEQVNFYVIKRFLLKSVIPFMIAALIAYALKNPDWIVLAPVLTALEKYLRDCGYIPDY